MKIRDRFGAWGLSTPLGEDWREQALCRFHDPDLWFPIQGDTRGETGAELRAYAKPRQICAACPVWRECRDYALTHDERYGMFGGLTPRQRRNLKRRSRKQAVA